MEMFFKRNRSKYVYVFSDCVFTKGFTRTSLIDTSRKRIYFIPNSFHELSIVFRNDTVGTIKESLADKESVIQFYKFVRFLITEHLAILVSDIKRFPRVDEGWDHPSPITNAIIDVRDTYEHVKKAIHELSDLRCEYLQIRIFESPSESALQNIATFVKNKCFKDVEVLFKFDPACFFPEMLQTLTQDQKNLRFLIHSAPAEMPAMENPSLRFTIQHIRSCQDCGIINQFALRIPSLQGLMENKLYNSCLNRKVAVDEHGDIGNCPSMKKKYGNIRTHSLKEIIHKSVFKKAGMIKKDQIEVCKDCEFRYICSDCRAYTENGTSYSKPAKCSYDPYSAMWRNETEVD